MEVYSTLEDALRGHSDVRCVRGVLFEQLAYMPTGERVQVGFRCFACDETELLAAFASGELGRLMSLPHAVGEDGSPVAGLVRLDLAFTPGGGLAGAQPTRYIDYRPVPAAEPFVVVGEAAAAWADAFQQLDQQEPD